MPNNRTCQLPVLVRKCLISKVNQWEDVWPIYQPYFYFCKRFFFIRRFFFERQRTIGLKSHLLKVETERKLMPLASLVFPRQRLHWTSSISHPHHTLFWFSHFSTRNPIFWGRKPNFLASLLPKLWEGQNLIYNRFGWEMSLLDVRSYIACKQLQSLTKAQTHTTSRALFEMLFTMILKRKLKSLLSELRRGDKNANFENLARIW